MDKVTTPPSGYNSQKGNVMDSKLLATTAHKLLKEMGHEMPLGHVYELFSKLSGHKSWNVAKTKDGFQPVINSVMAYSIPQSGGTYEVKVTAEVADGMSNIELKKYYRVNAGSESEAEAIIAAYIDYRENETASALSIPGVAQLLECEDDSDYRNNNWELIYFSAEINVQKGSTSRVKSRPVALKA